MSTPAHPPVDQDDVTIDVTSNDVVVHLSLNDTIINTEHMGPKLVIALPSDQTVEGGAVAVKAVDTVVTSSSADVSVSDLTSAKADLRVDSVSAAKTAASPPGSTDKGVTAVITTGSADSSESSVTLAKADLSVDSAVAMQRSAEISPSAVVETMDLVVTDTPSLQQTDATDAFQPIVITPRSDEVASKLIVAKEEPLPSLASSKGRVEARVWSPNPSDSKAWKDEEEYDLVMKRVEAQIPDFFKKDGKQLPKVQIQAKLAALYRCRRAQNLQRQLDKCKEEMQPKLKRPVVDTNVVVISDDDDEQPLNKLSVSAGIGIKKEVLDALALQPTADSTSTPSGEQFKNTMHSSKSSSHDRAPSDEPIPSQAQSLTADVPQPASATPQKPLTKHTNDSIDQQLQLMRVAKNTNQSAQLGAGAASNGKEAGAPSGEEIDLGKLDMTQHEKQSDLADAKATQVMGGSDSHRQSTSPDTVTSQHNLDPLARRRQRIAAEWDAQNKPTEYDSPAELERRRVWTEKYPPYAPFSIDRATKKGHFRMSVRTIKHTGELFAIACPHLVLVGDRHPYCVECMYTHGLRDCPSDCDFCSKPAHRGRRARMRLVSILSHGLLTLPVMIPQFVGHGSDVEEYNVQHEDRDFADYLLQNYGRPEGRPEGNLYELITDYLLTVPGGRFTTMSLTGEQLCQSGRNWIQQTRTALEVRYRTSLLGITHGWVKTVQPLWSVEVHLWQALRLAFYLDTHRVSLCELKASLPLEDLDTSTLDLDTPDSLPAPQKPIPEAKGRKTRSGGPPDSASAVSNKKRKRGQSHAKTPQRKKLKQVQPAAESKKQVVRTDNSSADNMSETADTGETDYYRVPNDRYYLPQEDDWHVVTVCQSDPTILTTEGPKCSAEAKQRNWPDKYEECLPVIEVSDNIMRRMEDRQSQFGAQLELDLATYQQGTKPLPITDDNALINMFAFNAPKGRLPTHQAELPEARPAGVADRLHSADTTVTVFDGDLGHIESVAKLTLAQLAALQSVFLSFVTHLGDFELEKEWLDRMEAINQTLIHLTGSAIEGLHHTVMTRRYAAADRTKQPTTASKRDFLSLMMGWGVNSAVMADSSKARSNWGAFTTSRAKKRARDAQEEMASQSARTAGKSKAGSKR